ncbi:hypothetical protein [Stenotrophomonas bentonitica]|uniref:hypothetical protein n=1 Tax=Stenotrophomonas bentonitica TaxID=1450134 RepID=UPI003BACCA48
MTDFSAFSNRSKYAAEINAGYSTRLNGDGLSTNPHMVWHDQPAGSQFKQVAHTTPKSDAWQHGWRLADKDQKGRGGAR